MEVNEFQNVENPGAFFDEVLSNMNRNDLIKMGERVHNEFLDGFERFNSYVLGEWFQVKYNQGSFFKTFKDDIDIGKNPLLASFENPIQEVYRFYHNGRIFKIDSKLLSLFRQTNNELFNRKTPFNSVLIPCNMNFLDGRINVFAILIGNTYIVKQDKEDLMIMFFGIDHQDNSEVWRRIFLESWKHYKLKDYKHYDTKQFADITNKDHRVIDKEIALIVCNFLDFLNHPEVETRTIKSDNNEKRIKRGKLPIPDRVLIIVNGRLYKYIYEDYEEMRHGSPKYSFQVRGHYMHFWNKKRWNKIYSLSIEELNKKGYQKDKNDIMSKWILPYWKGDGIRITKNYKIC